MNDFYTQLEEHRDRLTVYLRGILGDYHEAEDATQDVILRAFNARHRYSDEGKLTAWLFRIARNHGMNLIKRRRFQDLASAPEIVDPAPSVHERLANRERINELREAVDNLPDLEKAVVEMRLVDEITFREIATRTGAPINTVLGRMHSATKRLRGALRYELAA